MPVLKVWNGAAWEPVGAPVSVGDDTGWITPTLLNGWQHYSAWELRYRRINGVVYIKGLGIPSSAANSALAAFTLPEGFRPLTNVMTSMSDASGAVRLLYVETGGNVYYTTQLSNLAWGNFHATPFPAVGSLVGSGGGGGGTSGFTTTTPPALTAHTWSTNINHALNITGVSVSAYEVSTGENMELDWKRIDANNVQLRAGVAVAANSYVVYVSGR